MTLSGRTNHRQAQTSCQMTALHFLPNAPGPPAGSCVNHGRTVQHLRCHLRGCSRVSRLPKPTGLLPRSCLGAWGVLSGVLLRKTNAVDQTLSSSIGWVPSSERRTAGDECCSSAANTNSRKGRRGGHPAPRGLVSPRRSLQLRVPRESRWRVEPPPQGLIPQAEAVPVRHGQGPGRELPGRRLFGEGMEAR